MMQEQLAFRLPIFEPWARSGPTSRLVGLPTKPAYPSEQTSLADERIKQEIPTLRIVRKWKRVRVQTESGALVGAFLQEDAILLPRFTQKNNPKKPEYLTRVPMRVRSISGERRVWTVGRGKYVITLSQQREISRKLVPEVMKRLRPYTTIA